MSFPERVIIREVCPRDGWQKYKDIIPTETKIDLIRSMIDYGAGELELGVFSKNPKLSRQYQDIEDVARAILPYAQEKGVKITSLVNDYDDACRSVQAGINHVGCFISISERFGQGFGSTAGESFGELEKILKIPNIQVTLDLGAVFGCPFGDVTPLERCIDFAKRGFEMGVCMVGLADSAGKSSPDHVHMILNEFLKHFSAERLSIHLHNTEGFGIANAVAALESGMTHFDTSLGAMGGCPVIPNARGNIATEDFVNLLTKMGIQSEIDLKKCVDTSLFMSQCIGNPIISSKAELEYLNKV